MGNCSYCDIDCFYCIEKKETKFDFINPNINKIIPKKEPSFSQVRQAEYTFVSTNKRIKNDDITSVFTIDDNTLKKKFNESHESHLLGYINSKEMSLQIQKQKLYTENIDKNQTNKDIHDSNLLNFETNTKYFDEINKEGTEEEKKSDFTLRYNNTNINSANVSFLKYFEKIEDNSKNFDMTLNDKNNKKRLSNILPIRFNYQKEKYINYFADDSI
jgi:hypothetical protein